MSGDEITENNVYCGWPGCDYISTYENLWEHNKIHNFKKMSKVSFELFNDQT